MTRGWGRAGLAVAIVLWSQAAWAERLGIHDMAEAPHYGTKVTGMLARGTLNIATGYVDLLTRMVDETMAGPPVIGTLRGLGLGAGCGILRMGSGVVDWLTFWVPGFNGAPVAVSYRDCLRDVPLPTL
ncbi:MAG: hypothetical protein HYY91_05720 [Candidatus Omnitrophica bacterium]|nr:hypothetical protein [Candidatus Omnitrophota bacterium]